MRTAVSIVTIAAAASLASGCSTPEARGPKPAQPVKTATVALAPPQSAARYSASIEPFEQVSMAFKASGYVDSLLRRAGADGRMRAAQPGDRVMKGAVLARLRATEYQERLNQSRARLAEADASLNKARLDLARARTLFDADSLTQPELDGAQAAFDGAGAKVAAARADIELALSSLADCTLASPASGVILERRIEVGTLAAAGTVGFVIGDVSAVKARFGIPDAMIQSIAPGDTLDVVVDAGGSATFRGRVTSIAPAADAQSRVFDVEVTIPNGDGRLRPGMIGAVSVGASAAADSPRPLTVPLTAVVRTGEGEGSFGVLIVEQQNGNDVVRRRRVALGEVVGNAIVVRDGLAAGEHVVVSGASLLVDGDPVRVIR
jgi:RND family efflux transporter MFP subunit